MVEVMIEAENATDAAPLHDCDVEGIPRGMPRGRIDNRCGVEYIVAFHWKDLVDQAEQDIQSDGDRVPAINGRVPMKDFLKDLSITHQALTGGDQALRDELRVGFVGMRPTDQVHWHIGIDKDQLW